MAYRPPWSQKRESKPSGLRLTKQRAPGPPIASAPDLESKLAFPSLGEELRPKGKESGDFASAVNRVEDASTEEADEEETTGWVCMRMENGKITDRRPPVSMGQHSPVTEKDVERVITEMVDRWQGERDSLNQLLGDMSPYWDSLPIGEETDED